MADEQDMAEWLKGATLIMCGNHKPCDHDFQGWREFEDGRGGERVCTKCGLGAMAHTLSLDIWP